MKKVFRIKETLVRDVIVETPDNDFNNADIEIMLDEACGEGVIDLNVQDFDERFVSVINANPEDIPDAEVYSIKEDGTVYRKANIGNVFYNFPFNILNGRNTVSEKEGIFVRTTGQNYDFIVTVVNTNNYPVRISPNQNSKYNFESDVIPANDWLGLLANDDGYRLLEAFYNNDYIVCPVGKE